MKQIPWQWIQYFTVVAKCGSFSQAAAELAVSQPTLSRQIAAMEKKLTLSLFDRSNKGLRLTADGQQLLESSNVMMLSAEKFSRIASGVSSTLSGSIRISANEVVGLYYLPQLISQFNLMYPEVDVEIDISNKVASINSRDADIAIRMFRPTQPDLIAKRLADLPMKFTASKNYLALHGTPLSLDDAKQHALIGFDRDLVMIKSTEKLGWDLDELHFKNKTDFLPLQIELTRHGAGICVTHEKIIAQFGELATILENVPLPSLPCWLVCHADVQHNQKIRIMMDYLSENFK